MSLYKKIVYVVLVIAVVLLGIFVLLNRHSPPKLLIKTDSSPIKVQLNDTSYTISSQRTLTLEPGTYNYRAIRDVNGKRIVLQGALDLLEDKTQTLELNYKIYTGSAILSTLCEVLQTDSSCPLQVADLTISYHENFRWAVVLINSGELGISKAVLKTVSGTWDTVEGPATDIATGGYYPESVEKALHD
jgi:hypothetical protein